jgi:hypothetical protein
MMSGFNMPDDIIIELRLSRTEASLVARIFEIASERYAVLAKEEAAKKLASSADQAMQWQTFCRKIATEFRLALESTTSRSNGGHQNGPSSQGIGQD